MGLISAGTLIRLFRRMYDEGWAYVSGGAREGAVDCSGAFVWAWAQSGKRIPHGSNAIARGHVEALLPAGEALPGMAAFKRRAPGAAGYALPAGYRGGSDLNDYYHIGLVDETGRYVLSAQGTRAGFTRTPLSGWDCAGRLKGVDYAAPEAPRPMAVTAGNGKPVRVRRGPSASAQVAESLTPGTRVEALETRSGWTRIRYEAQGWMMTKYLKEE